VPVQRCTLPYFTSVVTDLDTSLIFQQTKHPNTNTYEYNFSQLNKKVGVGDFTHPSNLPLQMEQIL
jgi:hypothetical protein